MESTAMRPIPLLPGLKRAGLTGGSVWRVVAVAPAGAGPSLRGVSFPVAGL